MAPTLTIAPPPLFFFFQKSQFYLSPKYRVNIDSWVLGYHLALMSQTLEG